MGLGLDFGHMTIWNENYRFKPLNTMEMSKVKP
jgi:hypothetical protein